MKFYCQILELLGGLYSGSLAILTDAAHLLTDMSSFIISLVAIHLSERPPTKKLTYGWHRAEVLGALISVEAIWILQGLLSKIYDYFDNNTGKNFFNYKPKYLVQ